MKIVDLDQEQVAFLDTKAKLPRVLVSELLRNKKGDKRSTGSAKNLAATPITIGGNFTTSREF